MRILIRKTESGWQSRFSFGNPWKMPIGEWLPVVQKGEATSAAVSDMLMIQFPGAHVFTIVPIGEDLL
jgi:hypothetical protein